MRIKRRDLKRLIENYLKDHSSLTNQLVLNNHSVLKEYSFDDLVDDVGELYDDADEYITDVSKITGDVLEQQYDLITNYYSNISLDQFISDFSMMSLTEIQKIFNDLSNLPWYKSLVTELGLEVLALYVGGPIAGAIVELFLFFGPMLVPIGIEMLEGKTFDEIMIEKVLDIMQMAVDQNILTLEELKEFIGGGEIVSYKNLNEVTRTEGGLIVAKEGGRHLVAENSMFELMVHSTFFWFLLFAVVAFGICWAMMTMFPGVMTVFKNLPKTTQKEIVNKGVDAAKNMIKRGKSKADEVTVVIPDTPSNPFPNKMHDIEVTGPHSGGTRMGKPVNKPKQVQSGAEEFSDDELIDFIDELPPRNTAKTPKSGKKNTGRRATETRPDAGGSERSKTMNANVDIFTKADKTVENYKGLIEQSVDANLSSLKTARGVLQNRLIEMENFSKGRTMDSTTLSAYKESYKKVDEAIEAIETIILMKTRID